MTEPGKIKAIRVKLKHWETPDADTLVMTFEKVQPYITRRDFSRQPYPVVVFTGFGQLELTLKGSGVGANHTPDSWLTEYLDDDQVFIEDETANSLTFWNGMYENRYDWTSSYSIPFAEKSIREIPLTAAEWEQRYIDMTVQWDKIYFARNDVLELEFLNWFVVVTKGKIQLIMPDTTNPDVINFKRALENDLDGWLRTSREKVLKADMPEYDDKDNLLVETKRQTVLNRWLKHFWRNFFDKPKQ